MRPQAVLSLRMVLRMRDGGVSSIVPEGRFDCLAFRDGAAKVSKKTDLGLLYAVFVCFC